MIRPAIIQRLIKTTIRNKRHAHLRNREDSRRACQRNEESNEVTRSQPPSDVRAILGAISFRMSEFRIAHAHTYVRTFYVHNRAVSHACVLVFLFLSARFFIIIRDVERVAAIYGAFADVE